MESNVERTITTKPLWHGVFLVAGGAIGAGMFALPIISAGAWTIWASIGLILVWLATYLAASTLAKINIALASNATIDLDYQSSFSSLVKQTLGVGWERINNLSILFIMMILMYAYSTAGGNIISYTIENAGYNISQVLRQSLTLIFASIIGLIVWLGTSIVSRIVLILMIAMATTFGLASLGISSHVDTDKLFVSVNTVQYILVTLPVFVTAFACAGLVPSLVLHYQSKPKDVHKCLYWGTSVALFVYLFWIVITFGSVGREGFRQVISDGGNIANLSAALIRSGAAMDVESRLTLFSHFAVISSFLAVAVGLVHFVQDKLSLNQTSLQRLTATAICFLPPAMASFFYPYGFVQAIGLAGLFVAFSFFVIPSMMALKVVSRNLLAIPLYHICIVMGFGLLVFILKCTSLFGVLPHYE